ncbi:MAG: phosphatidylglycerol lysyltransferase domain-containing protein, partial [Desulfomonilaceae bacterium]
METFKPLAIEDKLIFDNFFKIDPPEASEYTFTNLFMWRGKYNPCWTVIDDCLVIMMRPDGETPFGLFPVGSGNKQSALKSLTRMLLDYSDRAVISRVEKRNVENFVDISQFEVR